MNQGRFQQVTDDFLTEMQSLLNSKGSDYSLNDDRLSNFKMIGGLIGPEFILQCWLIYFMKHVSAVITFVKTGKLADESIDSRLHDIANYAVLMKALLEDLRSEPAQTDKQAAFDAAQSEKVIAGLQQSLNETRENFERFLDVVSQLKVEIDKGEISGSTVGLLDRAMTDLPGPLREVVAKRLNDLAPAPPARVAATGVKR